MTQKWNSSPNLCVTHRSASLEKFNTEFVFPSIIMACDHKKYDVISSGLQTEFSCLTARSAGSLIKYVKQIAHFL